MSDSETIKTLKAENDKLIAENEQLKKRKKYGLVWEDKPEIFDEQSQCAFPILRGKDDKKYPNISQQTDDDNQKPHILIEGDNYHALSVLNITHQKKVDVIYIDPPYNTGAKDWKYNNDYVDKEDKFRHSKWLSFMAKRLKLAKNLLTDDGIFVIAIDHYELFNLGCLCDEIFGEQNRLGIITVIHNPKGRNLANFFSENSEYYLTYSKNINYACFNRVVITKKARETFNLSDKDGRYRLDHFMRARTERSRENKPDFWYPIYVSRDMKIITSEKKSGYHEVFPKTNNGEFTWKTLRKTFNLRNNGDYFVAVKENDIIAVKHKYREKEVLKNVWIEKKYHSEFNGTNLLKDILGSNKFNFPKSLYAVQDILKITCPKNGIILDFFAGSGTTAHAVLELNKQDGGNRQCILVTNNENNICEDITYERVKRVIEGYTTPKGRAVVGLGSTLHYLKTDFVPKDNIDAITDNDKIALSHQVGIMLALKENTFNEIVSNDFYQVFSSDEKMMGIYFSENIEQLSGLVDLLSEQDKPSHLYAYPTLYSEDFDNYSNIHLSEIPEHILKIYQSIGVI